MAEHRTGHRFKQGLFLGATLAVATGLSGCMSVDHMFDSGSSVPQAQAHVNPRDEVRARSMRCDSITDERAWLDCYYGAAQPVRADLALPPAPASQQALVPPPSGP